MDETNQKKSILEFFTNPWVGIVTTTLTIIGFFLSIYFYLNSTSYRELAYRLAPEKAVIVKSGQLSRLTAALDGKQIDTDVTAAQIVFWNEGKASIRKENILQPLKLAINPAFKIIAATVRKKSREIVNVDLDTTSFDQGELGISWNILEQGDGAVLQVIFAGPPTAEIAINGVIEGQRQLKEVRPFDDQNSRRGTTLTEIRTLSSIASLIAFAMLAVSLGFIKYRKKKTGQALGRPQVISLLAPVGVSLLLVLGFWVMLMLLPALPQWAHSVH